MFGYKLSKKGLPFHVFGFIRRMPSNGYPDADVFIHKKATRALADNRELSKLTPAKMFDAINK